MKVKKRSLILFISFAGLVLVYFTNCAGDLEMSTGLNTLCISQDCFSSNESKLALSVDKTLYLENIDYNSINSGSRATTHSALQQAKTYGANIPTINMCMIDVGGSCNDGGFADNIVEWELLNSQQSCSLKSAVFENQNSNFQNNSILRVYDYTNFNQDPISFETSGKCINGYFNVKVLYPCVVQNTAPDPNILVDNFGNIWQGPHELNLRVIGFDKEGRAMVSSNKNHASVTLGLPILQGQFAGNETCPQ